ncbi:MAG: class I SAM-dependent methyltransferase [Alphaproteobacteria bacterium]|jgi:hypothetical protein|nr:class I SAM-dependent methyltransferase [Alphaproteobacteria bacterium]
MDQRITSYIHRDKFRIEGWLHTDAALAIAALGERQQALGVGGGVAEIGVHHGKLFILLYLLGRSSEKAVAIDLFEDQHLNVDQSGNGDFWTFRRNLERHADTQRLVVHQGNSLDLSGADLVRLAGGPLRLASVDGGHTAQHAAHDLAVAEAALAEGGIVIVDDVFNEQWPGVAEGVHRYFARRPNLVPFAIGANKTYFCRPSHSESYRDAAVAAAQWVTMPDFLGERVAVLQFARRSFKDRFAHSDAWRRLRATPVGQPLRWAWHTGRRLRRGLVRKEDF